LKKNLEGKYIQTLEKIPFRGAGFINGKKNKKGWDLKGKE